MSTTMKLIISLFSTCLSFSLFADQSLYCPQNHGYINVGMTMNEVIGACGQPLSKQESKQPIFQKVPVQQLIYNNKGSNLDTVGPYSMTTQGSNVISHSPYSLSTGSSGAMLEIDIINNKVKEIKVNGTGTNAASFCEGVSIQIGDEQAKVMSSCGSPSLINNTFMNQVVPTETKPQIWIYKPDQYQSPVSLTFVDGKLQSIQ